MRLKMTRMAAVALMMSAACAVLPAAANAAQVAAMAAAPAVDRAQLLADVRTLASPEFAGRATGTEGSAKAQAYLAQRMKDLGLQPFGGAYEQKFSFTARARKGQAAGKEYPNAVNLIGFLRGTSAPDRYLVISAHYDHLGVRDGKTFFGADDDASGVAAVLAAAAWFKAHPPAHSVIFALFDGEELGLQGAKRFVSALPVPKEQVAMNLNLDMVSHNDKNEIYVSGTYHYPQLKRFADEAAGRSAVKVQFGHDKPAAIAAGVEDWTQSSDHGPFHAAGIPFLYFGVEDHADYHKATDTFEHINQDFFVRAAGLIVDTAAIAERHLDEVKK
jgi:Zn-dependent M28 family amino/carboxypeptidase